MMHITDSPPYFNSHMKIKKSLTEAHQLARINSQGHCRTLAYKRTYTN